VFNNNYYFSPLALPNYTDVTTIKATELVNADEIITVGYAFEPGSQTSRDIVIVKTKSSNGAVIWANSYGLSDLDERAYGLTVTYDGKNVIVVGTAQNKDVPTDWNGLAMKVDIATGAVVWSYQYGKIDEYQELRMIQRTFDGPIVPLNPTYMMVGTSSYKDVKSVLYAVSIFDNGGQQWADIYLDGSTYPDIFDYAFTMVKNPFKKFIICGTRYDNTGSSASRIFTMGIDPTTGSVSDKYIDYTIDDRPHFEGAICNVAIDDFVGYGLAFSSRKSGVDTDVDAAITVMLLDKDRLPINTNFYWQKEHKENFGLSIYQSTEEIKTFDVYTSMYKEIFKPGFLNVEVTGAINYFLKYNADLSDSKYATAMVRTKYGYTAKALHYDGDDGFMLAGATPTGKTDCAAEEEIYRKEVDAKYDSFDYKADAFGDVEKREVKVVDVHGKVKSCDGLFGQAFKQGAVSEASVEANSFHVYPNPMASNQNEVKLVYNLEQGQRVEISIYNALGQQVYRQFATLTSGSNQLPITINNMSPGVNFIVVRNGADVLYQYKIIKE